MVGRDVRLNLFTRKWKKTLSKREGQRERERVSEESPGKTAHCYGLLTFNDISITASGNY